MALVSTLNLGNFLDFRFDPECYRPALLDAERRVAALQPRPLEMVATVSDGNHVSIAEFFCESGVRYLKGAELSDVFIDDTDPTFIPPDLHAQITRAQVLPGDVLLSVIGSVGPVALVTDKYDRLSCSCKLAVLRPFDISGALLTSYLLSPTGQALLLRRNRGSVQQGVVLPDVRSFPVPKFSDSLVEKVEKAVSEASAAKRRADVLYPEAEAEMLERLGWEDLLLQPAELSYECSFSSLEGNSRTDAEFFQPRFSRLTALLEKEGAQRLDAVVTFCQRGVQPDYVDGGDVQVVNSKHLGPTQIDYTGLETTSNAFLTRKEARDARLVRGDVLIYATGAYIGRTNAFLSDAAAVASNHVTIVRADPTLCHPGFLALFLNSPAGLAQSHRFATGSAQRELYPQHIREFLVFLPKGKDGVADLAWQQRLAAKVEASVAARATASTKLEEATRLVEDALQVPVPA